MGIWEESQDGQTGCHKSVLQIEMLYCSKSLYIVETK